MRTAQRRLALLPRPRASVARSPALGVALPPAPTFPSPQPRPASRLASPPLALAWKLPLLGSPPTRPGLPVHPSHRQSRGFATSPAASAPLWLVDLRARAGVGPKIESSLKDASAGRSFPPELQYPKGPVLQFRTRDLEALADADPGAQRELLRESADLAAKIVASPVEREAEPDPMRCHVHGVRFVFDSNEGGAGRALGDDEYLPSRAMASLIMAARIYSEAGIKVDARFIRAPRNERARRGLAELVAVLSPLATSMLLDFQGWLRNGIHTLRILHPLADDACRVKRLVIEGPYIPNHSGFRRVLAKNKSLEVLVFQDEEYGAHDYDQIAVAAAAHPSLEALQFNGISWKHAANLAGLRSLRHLALWGVPLGPDEEDNDAAGAIAALLEGCPNFERLEVHNEIPTEDADVIRVIPRASQRRLSAAVEAHSRFREVDLLMGSERRTRDVAEALLGDNGNEKRFDVFDCKSQLPEAVGEEAEEEGEMVV